MNKLVDECNDTYHRAINKKPVHTNNSALTEKMESIHKALKFKVGDWVRITKHKNIFSKVYIENCSKEIFVVDSVLKSNPWPYKIKGLHGETIIGSFYGNNCCWMNYKRVIIKNQTAILEIKSNYY